MTGNAKITTVAKNRLIAKRIHQVWTSKGYQFFKVYNKKFEDGRNIKIYHYIKGQGDALEYVNYKVKTKSAFQTSKKSPYHIARRWLKNLTF